MPPGTPSSRNPASPVFVVPSGAYIVRRARLHRPSHISSPKTLLFLCAPPTFPHARQPPLLDKGLKSRHRDFQSTAGSAHPQIVAMTSERTESQTTTTSTHTATEDFSVEKGTNEAVSQVPTVFTIWGDIRAEGLEYFMLDADDIYHKNVFKSDIDDARVKAFLRESTLYHNGKWKDLIRVINRAENEHRGIREQELYDRFMEIIQAMFDFFDYPAQGRRIVLLHGPEDPDAPTVDKPGCPDFMVMGEGPNFHGASTMPEVAGHDHCASLGVIKTEENLSSTDDCLEVGVYARQCFRFQRHRRYVYSVILTELSARLIQYDRSGALQSARFNIHEKPEDFVRIILGFCAPDAGSIGFDTSVFWRGDKRYIKLNNQWEGHDPGEQEYELAVPAVAFSRRTLRGRGTVCWNALDSEGNIIIIKDSWRSVGREAESGLLAQAGGLDGVIQMLAYQDVDTDTCSNFRRVEGSTLPESEDRIFSRVALKVYGKSIECFGSLLDLLYVFRDAVNGHRNLFVERRILHRDISINNILHGKGKVTPGNRGVLIDFDRAMRIDRTSSLPSDALRTGTRLFQSVMVLKSTEFGASAPPHDYLDDLESFFYVLCWICMTYTGPKQCREEPKELRFWSDDDLETAANSKFCFLGTFSPNLIPPYFQPCKRLLMSLGDFLHDHVLHKIRTRGKGPGGPLMSLIPVAKEHYETYLGFIDEAIANLVAPSSDTGADCPPTPSNSNGSQDASGNPPTPTAAPNLADIRTPDCDRKRHADDELALECPSAKRSRTVTRIPPPVSETPSTKENPDM